LSQVRFLPGAQQFLNIKEPRATLAALGSFIYLLSF